MKSLQLYAGRPMIQNHVYKKGVNDDPDSLISGGYDALKKGFSRRRYARVKHILNFTTLTEKVEM